MVNQVDFRSDYENSLLWWRTSAFFFTIWFKLLFWHEWRRQEVGLVKRKKTRVGFQNKNAFCERDASDSLPVDQNHNTIKMNTDPLYFGC